MRYPAKVYIRKARPGDEAEIANVHVNSWREAYHDLLPRDFLQKLPLGFRRRKEWWMTVIADPGAYVLFVVEAEQEGIVGFACFSAGRDQGLESHAELQAMYLFAKYKGCGIGFNLLSAGFKEMSGRGFAKGYCWVLEKNPTIAFYEKTGARFDGETKPLKIGGVDVKERRYAWGTLAIGDYSWQPLSVKDVARAMARFDGTWAVAGGWAIDLFAGPESRPHDDIDVLIARADQVRLHEALPGWELWVADPPGALRPWSAGEFLGEDLQDIWCRREGLAHWQVQIMLFDVIDGQWIFKRDPTIRRDLLEVFLTSAQGVRYLAPEVQLLYKSKGLRAKDNQDFKTAREKMSSTQKDWLRSQLHKVYRDHPWLKDL